MKFSHYIITQFNLRNFPLSGNNDYGSWVKWTRSRIELFREYCLPSILNQSIKSFTWLLYFDSDTPREFDEFLGELKSFPFIDICYSKGIDDFHVNYIHEVKRRIPDSAEWVITSRIDNDDCLHRDAVRTIQENFVEKQKYLISLASGYMLNVADRTLSHYFYPMSPFISLIEINGEDIRGVYEKGHTQWDSLRLAVFKELWLELFNRKARTSRFILKTPMWVQTVHGANVSNDFYRGFPVLVKRNLEDYSLGFSCNRQPVRIIGRYVHYVTWKRYLKSLIVKILFNK